MRLRAASALLPFALAFATAGQAASAADTTDESADVASTEAQGSDEGATSGALDAPAEKEWELATIGYVWFAGAHGRTDVIGPVPPVDLRLSFGDVLKNFKFAFMGAAEARHHRLVFLGDLMFIHLGGDEGIGIRDPDFLEAELDSRTTEITIEAGYRVVNDGPVKVDLLAGMRPSWFNTSLKLTGPNREAEGKVKEFWVDPLIAARVGAPLGGKWSATLYGDIGGFGIASDITWQAIGSVNYQLNQKMRIGAGWRTFKVHYDKGVFLYDIAQNGPLLILRTTF